MGGLHSGKRIGQLVKCQKDIYIPERVKEIQVPLKPNAKKIQEGVVIKHEEKLVKKPTTFVNHQQLIRGRIRNKNIKSHRSLFSND